MTTLWTTPAVLTSFGRPWDYGVTWFTRRTVEPTAWPMTLDYIRNQVVKASEGQEEDEFLQQCLEAATQEAEDVTARALMPQTWEMVLSAFPVEFIELPHPPLIGEPTITYYDGDEAVQTLTGSPAEFTTVPSGKVTKARLYPLSSASWPSAFSRADAVTVTYQAGYADADSVPALIKAGIALMVAELYKQRTLSVHAVHNTPSVLQLDRFWKRVY